MLKESQEEPHMTTPEARVQRIMTRHQKMYENIESIIDMTYEAIAQTQMEIDSQGTIQVVSNLHSKMIELKPLKSVKDEYNDFYKKLSGFGKLIDPVPDKKEIKIEKILKFDEEELTKMQQFISDHYLSQKNFQAADSIYPNNPKRKLFAEMFQIRHEILEANFDRAAQWVQKLSSSSDRCIGYEIHKMKVIKLVEENKADEAIAYLRKYLAPFGSQHGPQISKLMNFVLTYSQKYWREDCSENYRNRYQIFAKSSLSELAEKFTSLYMKENKITIDNPISKCFEVGLQNRQKFLQNLKYMPQSPNAKETKVLPFSIKMDPSLKYHSQFFCPVNKEIYGPGDKNVVLDCGHMISASALSRITESRDSRRKMRCPICQSDQVLEQNIKATF